MADILRLKPAVPGGIVRDPETGRVLAQSGSEVPNTSYWRRRIRDGSAVVVGAPPAYVPPPPPPLRIKSAKKG